MTPDAQPAAKPNRRWYQFSVRTLLIGTAVFGLLFGAVSHLIGPAQRQWTTVRMIENLGGTFNYGVPPETWQAVMFRDWLPRDFFGPVVTVQLRALPT